LSVFANGLCESTDLTLSGDGTTHRHINYESKHIILRAPTYTRDGSVLSTSPSTRFLGISSAPNHSSETQLAGWKTLISEVFDVYNSSPLAGTAKATLVDFAAKIKGVSTDHAEDQKKLVRLIRDWKMKCDREARGETVLLSSPTAAHLQFLYEECNRKIDEAGGLTAWEALSREEKELRGKDTYQRICMRLGEEAFSKLSEEERQEAGFLVWAGCCMHKDLNSVKGGNAVMMEFWLANKLQPPIKLYNRDNEVAAMSGSSSAQKRAEEVSVCGGVKAASLSGALFNHKDDKRGQHDTLRVFWVQKFGHSFVFPDTSNTRYQSHCSAARVLIVNHRSFIEFLLLVRDKKESGLFNHLEQNVYNALHDIPTITELCILALYAESISHPYMRVVRNTEGPRCNVLDLGPLHDRVKAHCQAIISEPKLLLSPDVSHLTGSMDGKLWEHPEVIYTVIQRLPELPHLQGALVSFFQGALATWQRFSSEFAAGGEISQLSKDDCARAFMNATNDHNEGALGSFRVGMRRAPSMTLAQYNARAMYRMNKTRDFMRFSLTSKDRQAIRRAARNQDSSGIEKRRWAAQAAADSEAADQHRIRLQERQRKKDEKNALLDRIAVITDLAQLRAEPCPFTVADLQLQIRWHRRRKPNSVPKAGLLKTKMALLEALRLAVVDMHNIPDTEATTNGPTQHELEVPRASNDPFTTELDDDIDVAE
jgi:hypothetical protein